MQRHTGAACVSIGLRRMLRAGALLVAVLGAACTITLPEPPTVNLPTQPAVLDITPAPTLDIDATATFMADQLRPTPTPLGLYIVQPGDTLGSLAERFNTTVEEILVANDLSDANSLQAGQELIIPSLLPTELVGTVTPIISATATLESSPLIESRPLTGTSTTGPMTETILISPSGVITVTVTP